MDQSTETLAELKILPRPFIALYFYIIISRLKGVGRENFFAENIASIKERAGGRRKKKEEIERELILDRPQDPGSPVLRTTSVRPTTMRNFRSGRRVALEGSSLSLSLVHKKPGESWKRGSRFPLVNRSDGGKKGTSHPGRDALDLATSASSSASSRRFEVNQQIKRR